MKRFNVTGNCIPEEDYMVDISGKIAEIEKLVDNCSYFTINKARQYGKTTTLYELRKRLASEYIVASISFQGLGDTPFESDENFCKSFADYMRRALRFNSVSDEYREKWASRKITNFDELSAHITDMCKGKKIVLMIDEVDQASNNRVFLHFLGMLREKYIARRNGDDYTFHSVILAGVYDIRGTNVNVSSHTVHAHTCIDKNIKLRLMKEGLYTPTENENKLYNSPWNIAVKFDVDMSFSPAEISTMLGEYETDHETGMDIAAISEEIYAYTSGYPFLVSRICQCIDEELGRNWTGEGIMEAVKILLEEKNTLFDDLFKNFENNADLYNLVYDILIVGVERTFNTDNPTLNLGFMYDIIRKGNPYVRISNRVFEIRICEYFISKDECRRDRKVNGVLRHDVVKDGRFDMELCLRKFAEHYGEIYNENDAEFLERQGRLIFLSYLKPLINGGGFWHIESQLTDLRRMDIVVDYGREQFIIELKLWRGEEYQKEAYKQLLGYMANKKADVGYLLAFDFRKEKNKESKAEWVDFDGKKIFEVIV